MRTLYHFPICPFSRSIRILLSEKKLDFSLESENFWEKRKEFLELNSLGDVPVLSDLNGSVISHALPIFEYIESSYPTSPSITPKQISEIRRICIWIHLKIAAPIVIPILNEKHFKRFLNCNANTDLLRSVKKSLSEELGYATWLTQNRSWLASDLLSFADILLASMISSLDYTNDISWESFPSIKEWYQRIKCRPSFKSILQDRVAGLTPPNHYQNLDF